LQGIKCVGPDSGYDQSRRRRLVVYFLFIMHDFRVKSFIDFWKLLEIRFLLVAFSMNLKFLLHLYSILIKHTFKLLQCTSNEH